MFPCIHKLMRNVCQWTHQFQSICPNVHRARLTQIEIIAANSTQNSNSKQTRNGVHSEQFLVPARHETVKLFIKDKKLMNPGSAKNGRGSGYNPRNSSRPVASWVKLGHSHYRVWCVIGPLKTFSRQTIWAKLDSAPLPQHGAHWHSAKRPNQI